MLTEQAQVVAVEVDGVRVETIRRSACSSCQSKSVCGQKMLAEIGQGQRFELLATNPLDLILHSGDTVELGIEENSFLQASLIIYLLPLLGLVALASLGSVLGAAEGVIVLAGVSGLVGGFLWVRWWSQRQTTQCRFQPQILGLKH